MAFTEISKLHHYCQKILPLVYDESLSYYELLCKLTHTVNQCVDGVNNLYENLDVQLSDLFNTWVENNLDKVLLKASYDETNKQIILNSED